MKTHCTSTVCLALLLGAGLVLIPLTARGQPAASGSGTAQRGGWQPLFDGKTTNGWQAFNKPAGTPIGWVVEDGVLTTPGGQGDILTTGRYENFELNLE